MTPSGPMMNVSPPVPPVSVSMPLQPPVTPVTVPLWGPEMPQALPSIMTSVSFVPAPPSIAPLIIIPLARLTVSSPPSPLTSSVPPNPLSMPLRLTVVFPGPALIVSVPVGTVNVTVSLAALEMAEMLSPTPPASASVIVAGDPVNVKTRFVGERLSVIGSRPV